MICVLELEGTMWQVFWRCSLLSALGVPSLPLVVVYQYAMFIVAVMSHWLRCC